MDEASQYQYSYSGGGSAAKGFAIGDVDCDGSSATWELDITKTTAGNPQVNLVPPPAGAY